MSAISKEEAVELLTKEIEHFEADELREVYDAVFCYTTPTPTALPEDSVLQLKQLVEYVQSDLEAEVVVEIWRIVMMSRPTLSYDDEDGLFHYRVKSERTYVE